MRANLKSVEATAAEVFLRMNLHSNSDVAKKILCEALQERDDDRRNAYHERNQLVAFLSRFFPSHLARHPEADTAWDDTWRTIVCVHIYRMVQGPQKFTPVTWHLHDSAVSLFAHLEQHEHAYDGTSTDQPYERLAKLP